MGEQHGGMTKDEMEGLLNATAELLLTRASAKLSIPTRERALAEDALRLAQAENRADDKVVQSLQNALKGLLDFEHDGNPDSRQRALELDNPREGAAWRNAMGMAIALVDLKRSELSAIAVSQVQPALDEIAVALHAAHDEGAAFSLPRKLSRSKPRTPKPPVPRRPPSTMQEGLLAALPSDGTPILRTAVEDAMIAGNFAASRRSASRAFRELLALERISENGVRGRTKIAINL